MNNEAPIYSSILRCHTMPLKTPMQSFYAVPNPVEREIEQWVFFYIIPGENLTEIRLRVYDPLAQCVFESPVITNVIRNHTVCVQWDLCNNEGRFVSAGTFTAIVESIDIYGNREMFLTNIGIK